MGWNRGSKLAEAIWDSVKDYIPEDKKREVAVEICEAFEERDCDTLQEATDLFEAAYSMTDDEIIDYIIEICEQHADSDTYHFINKWLEEKRDNA